MQLRSPVTALRGVGPAIAGHLSRLDIHSVQDCLFHLPSRYIDRTQITAIGTVRADDTVLVQGMIELVQARRGKRRQLLCRISDGTGAMLLRFFHFTGWQKANLVEGSEIRCWGKVRKNKETLEIIHPEYQILAAGQDGQPEQTLTPVYPATEGLSQFKLRQLSGQALKVLQQDKQGLRELIPPTILQQHNFITLAESLRFVHRPPADADTDALLNGTHHTQQRLAFEELLAHQLSIRGMRKNIQEKRAYPVATMQTQAAQAQAATADKFIARLGFALTRAQDKVITEITADIQRPTPMLRLLQGDVGCGKTVVAAITALHAIDAGLKAALMAPTEMLSDQHYRNFKTWFDALGIEVLLLNAKQSRTERKQTLEALQSDRPLIVIGTHALFQEQVTANKLGLVIIDEQHRFGVNQRLALLEKGAADDEYPHQLIMTATPIPRTLAMTMFAELDISVIDELPAGRGTVTTTVLSSKKRPDIIRRINEVCAAGRQVYWVCTLIEDSETTELEAAEAIAATLADSLPGLKVALIHGKMKPAEKEQIMQAFQSARLDLLVATTVIEVGIDVPNANLMVIENAERLGLSQLHQLRGRVGRGGHQSYCVLLYQEPLTEVAQIRLNTLRETDDGFVIAQKDLQLRGPGELLGVRQTGLPPLKIADFARDAALIPAARDGADQILQQYPQVADLLIKRWLNDAREFGNV
ncbi:MAG: ATP-dependent DNA helicase RecG [Gammaproteobacteria bacterium]